MIGGFGGGASFCLFSISISLESTWSTVATKTAPTVNLSVDLITFVTVAFSLISLLRAFKRVWAHVSATGFQNCAIFK